MWTCLQLLAAVAVARTAPAQKSADAPASTDVGKVADEYASEVRAAVDAYGRHELAESRKHFTRAHALQPSARTYRGLGSTAFGLGMYEEAVSELQQALEDPRRPLTSELRVETQATLRIAQGRLAESGHPVEPAVLASKPAAAAQKPAAAPAASLHAEPAPAADSAGPSTQKIVALLVGSLGVVGVVTGAVFGLRSISQGKVRDQSCRDNLCDDARGYEAGKDAVRAGNMSTVAWLLGGAALAGSVVLWVTDTTDESHSPERQPTARLGLGLGSARLEGTW
jgi:hypothetical protein